jgi:gluconate 2-dehydrogenase alpha chain
MGTDAGSSVTNKYGQVWDTPNVFVTGATLFPQNAGMNPTETVCALAYLAADGIINQYVKDPGKVIAS